MARPKIFIGSSTEGLAIANAIHKNLDYFAEVTIWTQGVFLLSLDILSNLINSLSKFEFAIFIFSPDDMLSLRGDNVSTVRDNVIFETGLFIGKLGKEKVYFVKPRHHKTLHLPTDLLGIVAGEYDSDRTDGNWVAATGPFCSEVIERVKAILNQPEDQKLNYEGDIKKMQIYMKEKGWTSMSFEKIVDHIHPRLTEEYLMKIVDTYPETIRRCKLGEGKFGIRLIVMT